MTIGISAYDMPAPELLALAVAADQLGFDALWLGEHVVLPVGYGSDHPTSGETAAQHHSGPIVGPATELLDPFVMLGAIAGATRRLRLATGIYLLPLRHPLITARAACTAQDVSGGRFLLGVGRGWLREEFDALDVPFDERGGRFDEAIEILRRAWAGGPFDYAGDHFRFPPVHVTPRPVRVPLVLGGNSDRALRRAASLGDGWISSGTPSFDDALRLRDRLDHLAVRHGRSRPLECYFRVEGFDPALVEQYRSHGIDHVVVWADQVWHGGSLDERRRNLADAAGALGLPSPV